MSDVLFFRQATYAVSTKSSYRTHYATYRKFCDLMSMSLVPASNSFLCLYAAYLARFLLPQSVCQYINFVGLLHREMGFPNPLSHNWILSTVLKGIKRTLGKPPQPKLPILPDLLICMRSRLNLNCSRHASFWAICLVAFFGLFRKAHLLPHSDASFDPKRQFTRSDFVYSSTGITLTVRWSKTIQLGQRTVAVPLVAIPGSSLCPVTAVQHAFSFTTAALPNSQAFCWRDSSTPKLCVCHLCLV